MVKINQNVKQKERDIKQIRDYKKDKSSQRKVTSGMPILREVKEFHEETMYKE